MRPSQDYSITKRSCYLGFVTQAIVANFTPLLFMAFHREYQIPIASGGGKIRGDIKMG
jgi:hypothetical protein